MLQINTSSFNTRKKVEIDGHPYTVRKYGAGEHLTMNQLMTQADKLEKKLTENKGTKADEERAVQIGTELMNLVAGLFDDGGDGSKSYKLVSTLSKEEIGLLLNQIFDDGKETS